MNECTKEWLRRTLTKIKKQHPELRAYHPVLLSGIAILRLKIFAPMQYECLKEINTIINIIGNEANNKFTDLYDDLVNKDSDRLAFLPAFHRGDQYVQSSRG
jgi:hypothetical protein